MSQLRTSSLIIQYRGKKIIYFCKKCLLFGVNYYIFFLVGACRKRSLKLVRSSLWIRWSKVLELHSAVGSCLVDNSGGVPQSHQKCPRKRYKSLHSWWLLAQHSHWRATSATPAKVNCAIMESAASLTILSTAMKKQEVECWPIGFRSSASSLLQKTRMARNT
jgi:hypothetical protein